MVIEAWHETTAHRQLNGVASAINALCDCGLRIRPPRPGWPGGDGLLSFASVDDITVEALRQLTQASRSPVIAIQVAGPPLKPQDYRRLVQAGADDILSWLAPAQHTADCAVARLVRPAPEAPRCPATPRRFRPGHAPAALAARWALRRASSAPAT